MGRNKPDEASPLPDSAARGVSSSAKQFIPVDGRGLLLEPDGRVLEWGHYLAWPSLGDHVRPLSSAAPFDWPADVVALSQSGYALRADGTVWAAIGERILLEGSYIRQPVRRVEAPADVASFASGTSPAGQHVVTRGGEVWRLGGARVAGATNVSAVDCNPDICVAVQRDGRVIYWGVTNLAIPVRSWASASEIRVAVAALGWNWVLAIDRRGQLMASGISGGMVAAVAVAGFSDATDISCTPFFCVIRRSDGSLWGFGVAFGTLHPANPEFGGSAISPVRLTGFSLP